LLWRFFDIIDLKDDAVFFTPDFNKPNKLNSPFFTTGTVFCAADSTDAPTRFNPFLTLYVTFLAPL
jgi:hypothetical protein